MNPLPIKRRLKGIFIAAIYQVGDREMVGEKWGEGGAGEKGGGMGGGKRGL